MHKTIDILRIMHLLYCDEYRAISNNSQIAVSNDKLGGSNLPKIK